jgi:hypothetical protein
MEVNKETKLTPVGTRCDLDLETAFWILEHRSGLAAYDFEAGAVKRNIVCREGQSIGAMI